MSQITTSQAVTPQALEDRLVELMCGSLRGFTVDIIPMMDGRAIGPRQKAVSVGRNRSVKLDDIVEIVRSHDAELDSQVRAELPLSLTELEQYAEGARQSLEAGTRVDLNPNTVLKLCRMAELAHRGQAFGPPTQPGTEEIADQDILDACPDWSAPYEIAARLKTPVNYAFSLQLRALVEAGWLEYGAANNTYRCVPDGGQDA